MKILYLLNDGAGASVDPWIKGLAGDHQAEVIDLAAKTVPYDALVDKIFANDKVISWGGAPALAERQHAGAS